MSALPTLENTLSFQVLRWGYAGHIWWRAIFALAPWFVADVLWLSPIDSPLIGSLFRQRLLSWSGRRGTDGSWFILGWAGGFGWRVSARSDRQSTRWAGEPGLVGPWYGWAWSAGPCSSPSCLIEREWKHSWMHVSPLTWVGAGNWISGLFE